TPDRSTARWTFPPLIAAISKPRTAGQVEMSISPSRTTAADSGSETPIAVMDAPASHEANGRVRTACPRVYAWRPGPGYFRRLHPDRAGFRQPPRQAL